MRTLENGLKVYKQHLTTEIETRHY